PLSPVKRSVLPRRSKRDITAGTLCAPQSRCKRHMALPGCKDSEHHGANLGSRLTIWDRLFGTYVDPEGVGEISFGIEGAPSPTRRSPLKLPKADGARASPHGAFS